jgi:hypothetical protein
MLAAIPTSGITINSISPFGSVMDIRNNRKKTPAKPQNDMMMLYGILRISHHRIMRNHEPGVAGESIHRRKSLLRIVTIRSSKDNNTKTKKRAMLNMMVPIVLNPISLLSAYDAPIFSEKQSIEP